jgi:hypothetical protein
MTMRGFREELAVDGAEPGAKGRDAELPRLGRKRAGARRLRLAKLASPRGSSTPTPP